MPTILFLLVIWLLKNAAVDVTCAVKGTTNPRYEAKAAKLRAAGQRAATAPRYGSREYFGDFWADLLAEKTEVRRQQREKRRRLREEADALEPFAPWNAPPAPRPRPTPARNVGAGRPATRPAPAGTSAEAAPTAPASPDTAPVPRPRPTPTPVPPPAGQPPVADAPTARIFQFPQQFTPEESTVTTSVNGEVVGLDQSIAYTENLAKFAGEHGPAGNEGYIGHLTASKVSGTCLTSAHEMQAAFGDAMASAARHAEELKKQKPVQEAYQTTPDAGDKEYQTQGS